jgi:hypothetical protein
MNAPARANRPSRPKAGRELDVFGSSLRPEVPTGSGCAVTGGAVVGAGAGAVVGAVAGSGVTGAVLATGSVGADAVGAVVGAVVVGFGSVVGIVLVADWVLVDALVVDAVGAGVTGAGSGTVLVADCVLVDALVVDAVLELLVVEVVVLTLPDFHALISVESVSND